MNSLVKIKFFYAFTILTNCYNTGFVNGLDLVGGVCGYNDLSIIENCYNTGTINEESCINGTFVIDYIGGVCGLNNKGTITNCYNTGTVSGIYYIGGICGRNERNYAEITNCYNTGTVSGTSDYVGGVCGDNYDGTITNCYYLNTTASTGFGSNSGTLDNVDGKATDDFNSGEVAYLLQSSQQEVAGKILEVWGQTLTGDNKQDYPVLGGAKIYTANNCTGYSNTENDTRSHNYVNGICQWCGDVENEIMIYGQSITLDGTIGMNIYVAADDNYEWSAKIDNVEVTKPKKDENGLYKFTCKVAAKDMEKNITFYINENVNATVSVKKYLDALDTADDTKLANLVTAMETYGTAANAFFKGESVAAVEGVTAADLESYGFTKGTAPEGITYYGSSLILESETTIRHYFTIAEGYDTADFAFTVNGSEASLTESEKNPGYYFIDIKNISAEKLGDVFSVSVNGDTVISNYSALSYAKKVLDSEETDDNLKNLVKALYLYNQNVIAYNEPQKEDLK